MAEDSKMSDTIINIIIIALSAYLIYYVVIPLWFPRDTGCGCNKGRGKLEQPAKFDDTKFSPADKACLAVGTCVSNVPVPEIAIYVWRKKIEQNAEKIFGKGKENSGKQKSKRRRN